MICSMKYDARVDLWSVGVILYGKLLINSINGHSTCLAYWVQIHML